MAANVVEKEPVVMPALRPSRALLIERFGPAAIGVLVSLSVLKIPALWLLRATWHDLMLDKTVDVELGLLAGSIGIVAFLPAIEEKTIIKKIKQWGWYKYLVGYLKEAIVVSSITLAFTLSIIVMSEGVKSSAADRLLSSVWWGLVVHSVCAALRIVNLSLKSLIAG